MSDGEVEVAAARRRAVMQQHRLNAAVGRCTCGYEFPTDRALERQQERHVAMLVARLASGPN